jgi:uncharacterized protein (TIGR03435 family)
VTANEKLPEFQTADIQLSKGESQTMAQFLPGGKVQFQALQLKFIILAAWGYEYDEHRISGGPSWMDSDRFDLMAQAPPDSSMATMRFMLKDFLMKRFGLQAHLEDTVMPVYALSKGKGALAIKPSATAGASECVRSNEAGVTIETCHNMTMDDLANGFRGLAPVYIDKPVVNQTDIKGAYDFELRWTPRAQFQTAGGITVFDAVDQQLGLMLESTTHAVPIIVIDKISPLGAGN